MSVPTAIVIFQLGGGGIGGAVLLVVASYVKKMMAKT